MTSGPGETHRHGSARRIPPDRGTAAVKDLAFLLPGDLATLTGGCIYDRRIIDGLRALGWRVTVHQLDPGFPLPTAAALRQARQVLGAIADGRPAVIDGLALGAMPDLVATHADRLRIVALVHHPLALETGLTAEQAGRLKQSEEDALARARLVLVTSPATARSLVADYAVSADRIAVVEPGTDPAPLAEGSGDGVPELLCVASLTPRKGHAVLFDALSDVRDRPWRLTCAGSLERSPETAAALRARVARLGLEDRVCLVGEVRQDALAQYYRRADLFVLASWLEGYGMVLAEALAHGLPVISTTAGAIPDTVPADAGLLVPPGDRRALAAALARFLDDRATRETLAEGARQARAMLPGWDRSCALFAAAIERKIPG
jgi:glycosyltransferase involved in cell wall biosynthesis